MTVSIVAVLSDVADVHACLDAAATAAAIAADSRVEAFHPRPMPEHLILPSEEVMTARRHAELADMLDRKSLAVRQAVDEWRAAGEERRSVLWNEQQAETIRAGITARAETADLLVLVRPSEANGTAALHAAIFDTHKLLLLVPPGTAQPFGSHMAIAWKTSATTARTVTAAMPWLRRASRVSVLTVARPGTPAPLSEDDVALFERHGIAPEVIVLERGDDGVAARLLQEAHALGADCLVMGAYRHNRLIEFVLGGVTDDMLQTADLPLLMMH